MSKFKVLEFNQAFMARIGNYSYRLTVPTNEFLNHFVSYIILITMIIPLVSAATLIYNNTYGFTSKLNSVFMMVGLSQGLGAYVNIGANMKQIKQLHLKLQSIVDACEDGEAYEIYWSNEKKCRKYTKFMTIFYVIQINLAYFLMFLYSIYSVLTGNYDYTTWPAFADLALPFNTDSVAGWYTKWFILTVMDVSYVLGMMSASTYFMCICLYIETMCEYYDYVMRLIHTSSERNQLKENEPFMTNSSIYLKIKQLAHKAIKAHVEIYEIFNAAESINSGSIFFLLIPNIIFLGITFYNIEHSFMNLAPIDAFYAILCILFGLNFPFLFCYFANHITDRISDIAESTYDLKWFEFPTDVQKLIILIMARAQQPVYFTGFSIVYCSIENFGMLFKSSCSYYLIFREFMQD